MSAENARLTTAIVLAPGEGTAVGGSAGTPTIVKLHGSDVRGAYSLLEMEVSPGNGNALHIHHHAEEVFYVVEGELTIRFADREELAPAGTVILVPRGMPHSFKNAGDRPVKALFIFSPPGTEDWFVEMTKRRQSSPAGTLDRETVRALALTYGTEFVE